MRFKLVFMLWIGSILSIGKTKDIVDDVILSSGDGIDDVTKHPNSNIQKQKYNWFPRLNVTCLNNKAVLADNPGCLAGKVAQNCRWLDGIYKTIATRSCATSQREIDCTEQQVLLDISRFNGDTFSYQECSQQQHGNCKEATNNSCIHDIGGKLVCKCKTGRAAHGWEEASDEDEEESSPIRTIAFSLAGTVMVGLLLFAVFRIRKATIHRRSAPTDGIREVQGVDNEALGALPQDSRLQTILNTINASGKNYELRERADSVPGRRVYVLSPTAANDSKGGRGFSRTTSQLSSIAEESTEDAMSHITEATEPAEDDCFFKYDSDAINEVNSMDCAFEENVSTRPDGSSEAINCINDVIAMYDIENGAQNEVDGVMDNLMPASDYRQSGDHSEREYLQNFGWKPQERTWKIEKLKDKNSKSNEPLSASCSTLNSLYSGRSCASSSASLGNACYVTTSDLDSLAPLLGNGSVTSSNLKTCKSLPCVLDTSQIPDIEEMLADELEQGATDVLENGIAHA